MVRGVNSSGCSCYLKLTSVITFRKYCVCFTESCGQSSAYCIIGVNYSLHIEYVIFVPVFAFRSGSYSRRQVLTAVVKYINAHKSQRRDGRDM